MIFDPLELNYSKLRAYLDCPFLYRFIYVERRFAAPSAHSSLGLSVHKALAAFHARPGDLGDLTAYYDDAWQHQGYATPQQSMEFYRRGAKVLEDWWMHWQQNPAQVLYSEKSFAFPYEKWLIKGTIDRVDRLPGGAVELLDYKMGFEDRGEWDAAGSLQLALYALGLERGLKQRVAAMGYFILSSLKKVSVPYDQAAGEAALALVRENGPKMLEQVMDRKGDCARCAARQQCPESLARDSDGGAAAK